MKKKLILNLFLTFIGLSLTSCHFINNGVFVKITNSSTETVTDVFFSSDKDTKIKIDKINPGQTVRKYLDMSRNTPDNSGDGSYLLTYIQENGKKISISDGYYTNGQSLDSRIVCEIKKDTATIK